MTFSVIGLARFLCIVFSTVILFSAPALCANEETAATQKMLIPGIFSIGPDGKTYMLLTDVGAKFQVGDIVGGVVPDKVLAELARRSPIQRAAFLAIDAAELCRRARERTTPIPQTDWSLLSVDSEELVNMDGAAVNAFDGDASTIWHTEWPQTDRSHPHEIRIDLGAAHFIDGFRYLPRQDGRADGRISMYEFYVSPDGVDWGDPVVTGTFANDAAEKEVFFEPKTARFIHLKVISEVSGNPWTSMAEINVLSNPTADLACARAAEIAALEVTTWATEWRETNPDPAVVEWVEQQLTEAESDIERFQKLGQISLAAGGEPYELEGYEAPPVALAVPSVVTGVGLFNPIPMEFEVTEQPISP